MELKDFIDKSLAEILEGIAGARSKHGNIAPQIYDEISHGGEKHWLVEFDVAVTTTEATSKEGGAAVKVLSANIGGKKSDKDETVSATRIKFSVPVYFLHKL